MCLWGLAAGEGRERVKRGPASWGPRGAEASMGGELGSLDGQVFAVTGGAGYFGSRLCIALLKR